jgi:chemotaxis protein MotB
MARRRKLQEESGGGNWLTTYGDMVTLLLTFFVFLFSFSSIDVQKFQKMLLSFQGALGVLPGGKTVQENGGVFGGMEHQDAGESKRTTINIQEVAQSLKLYLKQEGLERQTVVRVDQRGITVSISDQLLFETGRTDMKPEGKRVLFKLAQQLRDVVPALSVEGHTDSVPLRGGPLKNNWGLAALRASTVASYLQESGGIDPRKIQAVSYGAFRPIVPNDTPEHRALNRRVDLVILSQYPK